MTGTTFWKAVGVALGAVGGWWWWKKRSQETPSPPE